MRTSFLYSLLFLLTSVPAAAVAQDPSPPPQPDLDEGSPSPEATTNETANAPQPGEPDTDAADTSSDEVERAGESADNATSKRQGTLDESSIADSDAGPASAADTDAATATLDAVLAVVESCSNLGRESDLSPGGGATGASEGAGGSGSLARGSRSSTPLVVAPVEGFGFDWLFGAALVGLSFGVGSMALARRGRREMVLDTPAEPKPATEIPAIPAPTVSLADLARHVQNQPLDAAGQFAIGVEFLRNGDVPRGIRHLELSVRMDPAGLLVILDHEDLEDVRRNPDVRRFLRRYHDEQQRRLWSGYA